MGTGLESGNKLNGFRPGIKSGRSLSQMRSGSVNGLNNGIMNRRNMQDPVLISGVKAPILYWNAESCTVNASNNVLSVTNLITSSVETFSVSSDPNRVTGSVYGIKSSIDFDTTDFIATSQILNAKTEATLIIVAKPTGSSGQFLFNSISTTFADTPGDFTLVSNGGTITANFIGDPNTTDCTITSYPLSVSEFYIITLKLRLTQNGTGIMPPRDVMEMYINGIKQSNYTATTYILGAASFSDIVLRFGGNSSQTLGGNSIASGLVFDYFLSEAVQIRIENYFRWYYGRNF